MSLGEIVGWYRSLSPASGPVRGIEIQDVEIVCGAYGTGRIGENMPFHAGENMVLYANVTTGGRHFGRGGAGAVMGSKNLKAIAVRGTQRLQYHDEAGLIIPNFPVGNF